ncbi:hypothetical protein JJB07_05545 [Tumebacillus sp. ITR2]|uniref:Inhibitor I9 domain-containing protein n=1 Tax=Tumebacillus amylolyticus TaxID=2801339 RepID=A0ABS1J8Z0_9BACL|nr:hypothetical protein [Tumebacillus amylolyticus]MBL0386113.1 hypothetical protein [Tumebacillus amylolyticus]
MAKKSHGLSVVMAVGLFVGLASSAMSMLDVSGEPNNSGEYPVELMSMKKAYNSLSADQKQVLVQSLASSSDSGEYSINVSDFSDSAEFVSPKAQYLVQ